MELEKITILWYFVLVIINELKKLALVNNGWTQSYFQEGEWKRMSNCNSYFYPASVSWCKYKDIPLPLSNEILTHLKDSDLSYSLPSRRTDHGSRREIGKNTDEDTNSTPVYRTARFFSKLQRSDP